MSDNKVSKLKEHIVKISKKLHKKNMLAAADGNISFRVSDEEIWITPSGVIKAFMEPEEMACINIRGEVLLGKPSSEMAMHLQVYKSCPEAMAVIHAHPPHAIAWSIAKPELTELPLGAMSELILACGQVPMVPFAMPGTQEMADNLVAYLPKNKVMILARHGALCWGGDLIEAYRGMERLEHSTQILSIAHSLGGVTQMSLDKVEVLKKMREEIVEKMGEVVL